MTIDLTAARRTDLERVEELRIRSLAFLALFEALTISELERLGLGWEDVHATLSCVRRVAVQARVTLERPRSRWAEAAE